MLDICSSFSKLFDNFYEITYVVHCTPWPTLRDPVSFCCRGTSLHGHPTWLPTSSLPRPTPWTSGTGRLCCIWYVNRWDCLTTSSISLQAKSRTSSEIQSFRSNGSFPVKSSTWDRVYSPRTRLSWQLHHAFISAHIIRFTFREGWGSWFPKMSSSGCSFSYVKMLDSTNASTVAISYGRVVEAFNGRLLFWSVYPHPG